MYCTLLVQMNGYTKVFEAAGYMLHSRLSSSSQGQIAPRPHLASVVRRNSASRTALNLAVLLRVGPRHRLDKDLAHVDIDVLQLNLKHITIP